jgi:hypothetical protein
MGLSPEQIAGSLNLSVAEVEIDGGYALAP